MHLVTLMDYSDRESLVLCKAWIALAKRHHENASITIFSQRDISSIRSFARRYTNVYFETLPISSEIRKIRNGCIHLPTQDLQLALWDRTRVLGIHKYIYLDADALIVGTLDDWWNIIDDKPYIAIPELLQEKEVPLLNAGVYSYSSRSNFITTKKLISQYYRDGSTVKIQAGQQGLINSYFQYIHYDFTHQSIGHEYNVLAKYSDIRQVSDGGIIIYSGSYPFAKKVLQYSGLVEKEWGSDWMWWGLPKRARIIHSFGVTGNKFWDLPECNTLWSYCCALVR